MELLLAVITLISVATAIAALTSVARLRRGERQRSDARVAALAAAADAHGSADGEWRRVAGEWQWMAEPAPQANPVAQGFSPVYGSPSATGDQRQASLAERPSETLFGTVQREEPSGSRLPIFAAAALIVMLGGALIFLNTSASNEHAASAAHAGHSEPLELVALGHARETSMLTISGTVRNPASGVKLEGLTAVVSLLDRNGALVSTKDVPLDYRALGPGEEAPFRLSVPDAGSVARYRVSFRAGGDVVPHVDRRVDTKLASAVQ